MTVASLSNEEDRIYLNMNVKVFVVAYECKQLNIKAGFSKAL